MILFFEPGCCRNRKASEEDDQPPQMAIKKATVAVENFMFGRTGTMVVRECLSVLSVRVLTLY
jgi:hypothetical protein